MGNRFKKLFKISIGIFPIFIIGLFVFTNNVFATSGACSYHNGVNCSMGRQLNGKVYCNDGWTDSMVEYDFMVACQNQSYGCSTEEWNNLYAKYQLEELYSEMQKAADRLQQLVDSGSSDLTLVRLYQAAYNAVSDQFDLGMNLAKKECSNLGADRTLQLQYYLMQLDSNNAKIKAEQDKLDALNKQGQVLNELEKQLNAPQYVCPANSTLVGDKCYCIQPYTFYNNQCIPSADFCNLVYGNDYDYNVNLSKCQKREKPTSTQEAIPVTDLLIESNKKTSISVSGLAKTSENKSEQAGSEITQSSTETLKAVSTSQVNIPDKKKNGIIKSILNSIGGLFRRIFRF